ncbi:MAG TPA: hypothetical protein VI386_17795 [Candidatus Sulfotelmatobacter sp.]
MRKNQTEGFTVPGLWGAAPQPTRTRQTADVISRAERTRALERDIARWEVLVQGRLTEVAEKYPVKGGSFGYSRD